MCYYNSVSLSKKELNDFVEEDRRAGEFESLVRSGFDYDHWPIISRKNDKLTLEAAHWGFIPYWYRERKQVEEGRKKYTTLNAVGEKLLESRIYKEAAVKRRCLVLSSGFYEWRHFKPEWAKKEAAYPYYVTLKDHELFFMAGIWQPWTDKETGEHIDTFALITTAANGLMEQIHNKKKRVPTILTKELAKEWIQKDLSEEGITEIASYQIPLEQMQACTIRKNFKANIDPREVHLYEDLPAQEYVS
jgi:putative SOS response-associated peptidase YedK